MNLRWILFATVLSPFVWCAGHASLCQASSELEAEIRMAAAASAAVTSPFAALDRAGPFLAVRDRHPDDPFAHERYQDAMHENGIEGHLRLLARQYRELEAKRPGDPVYRYLSLRAVVGRTTPDAIQGLNLLLADHPDFAPAYRTLAEIYGTEAFRDPEKEQLARTRFLTLCPAGTFTHRPASVPAPSPLLDQAERMLLNNGDPDRIVAMTVEGLKEFEWRSQRIRCFDWYSRDDKVQDARELRAKYWQAWPIQVRCYRKAGRTENATQLLSELEMRAKALRNQPGAAYWNALDVLARLYAEGKQAEQATKKLEELRQLLAENQDPAERARRAARLEDLRAAISGRSR